MVEPVHVGVEVALQVFGADRVGSRRQSPRLTLLHIQLFWCSVYPGRVSLFHRAAPRLLLGHVVTHIAISLSRAIRCSWGRSPLTELQAPQSNCRLSKWSAPPLL